MPRVYVTDVRNGSATVLTIDGQVGTVQKTAPNHWVGYATDGRQVASGRLRRNVARRVARDFEEVQEAQAPKKKAPKKAKLKKKAKKRTPSPEYTKRKGAKKRIKLCAEWYQEEGRDGKPVGIRQSYAMCTNMEKHGQLRADGSYIPKGQRTLLGTAATAIAASIPAGAGLGYGRVWGQRLGEQHYAAYESAVHGVQGRRDQYIISRKRAARVVAIQGRIVGLTDKVSKVMRATVKRPDGSLVNIYAPRYGYPEGDQVREWYRKNTIAYILAARDDNDRHWVLRIQRGLHSEPGGRRAGYAQLRRRTHVSDQGQAATRGRRLKEGGVPGDWAMGGVPEWKPRYLLTVEVWEMNGNKAKGLMRVELDHFASLDAAEAEARRADAMLFPEMRVQHPGDTPHRVQLVVRDLEDNKRRVDRFGASATLPDRINAMIAAHAISESYLGRLAPKGE